jgi:acyl-CoA oxidase
MMEMYNTFDRSRKRGDFAALPELHALSSGLKSLCTDIAAAGIEACRRTCGGHGYSMLSGLPTLFASYVQNVTWEGDNNGGKHMGGGRGKMVDNAANDIQMNSVPCEQLLQWQTALLCVLIYCISPFSCPLSTVMYLQTARYLLKALLASSAGKELSGSSSYLAGLREEQGAKCAVAIGEDWRGRHHQLAAMRCERGSVHSIMQRGCMCCMRVLHAPSHCIVVHPSSPFTSLLPPSWTLSGVGLINLHYCCAFH